VLIPTKTNRVVAFRVLLFRTRGFVQRQHFTLSHCGVFGLLALFAYAPAFAQYSIAVNATPTGPGTCDSTSVTQFVTGSVILDLPLQVPNGIAILVVNGVLQSPIFGSAPGPFPVTMNIAIIGQSIPSITPPYTYSVTAFPYVNGMAQGTGYRVGGTCSGDGTAIMSIQNGISAVPPALAVPALSIWVLGFLALLLAFTGGWRNAVARSSPHQKKLL
jgi:hypothetical protein